MKEMEIDINKKNIIDGKYEIIQDLGKDNFTKKFLVKDLESGSTYICNNYKIKYKKIFENEYNIYKNILINNPSEYLIKYKDSNGKNKDNIYNYIILEYAENDNLFNYIDKLGGFTEIDCKLIFEQILKGVNELHERGLCHLNLNLMNILLDKNYNIKLSDLGNCENNTKRCKPSNFSEKKYRPPEASNEFFDGIKSEIYTLGFILLELATGKTNYFWDKVYEKTFIPKEFNKFWAVVENHLNTNLSLELKKLIKGMISYNPDTRKNYIEIIESEWMSEINVDEKKREELESNLRKEFDKRKLKIITRNKFPSIYSKNSEPSAPSTTDHTTKSLYDQNIEEIFNKNTHKIKYTKSLFPLNDIVYIQLSSNPYEIMNILYQMIKKYFVDISIKNSEKSLKFTVTIKKKPEMDDEFINQLIKLDLDDVDGKKEEEENDELEEQIEKDTTNESVCIIDIKLFKYENEFYLIRFVRKSNDITLYYKYMEIIFSIIENNFVKQTNENKTTKND